MSKLKIKNYKLKAKKINEIVVFDAVRDNNGKGVKGKKLVRILEKNKWT